MNTLLRRALILSVLAGAVAAPVRAQVRKNGTWVTRIGFNVQVGRSWSSDFKSDSYGRFQEAYNRYYASRLRTPLPGLGLGNGWFYGGDFHVGPMYLSFIQHRFSSTAVAELRNGDRREMTLDLRPLEMNCDLLLPIGGRVEAGAALGWQQQKGALYSGYRYANGPLSYAEDQALNGIYRTRNANALNLGVRVDVKLLKRQKEKSLLTLSLRAERVGAFQSLSASSDKLLPWHDVMMTQATNGSINNDGWQSFYLSENPRDQFSRAVRWGSQGEAFHGPVTGWRACATLIITPLEWILPD